MLQKLVNHNDDIRRLVDKGYAVGYDSGYLIIRDIPYFGSDKSLEVGSIVAKLVFIDEARVQQSDHQVFFAGGIPYGLDGKPIPNLGGGSTTLALSAASHDIVVQRSFSNKPVQTGKFSNFFEKVESYVSIISGPAMELHDANPLTFKARFDDVHDSVFKFQDTLTSRSETLDLSNKLRNDVIAVFGLGGSGAYLLDFLVKTSVKEIRAFDGDFYHVHNAFRSPGRLLPEELGKRKADIYKDRYQGFRDGLNFEARYIDSSCGDYVDGVTFAFVCVDRGEARKEIFDLLISKGIPFIDVGMGLNRKNGPINGMLRATHYPADNAEAILNKNLSPLSDNPNDEYRTNIQIGELNALNACLAVIRYKQLRGFYLEDIPYYNLVLSIGDIDLVGESEAHED